MFKKYLPYSNYRVLRTVIPAYIPLISVQKTRSVLTTLAKSIETSGNNDARRLLVNVWPRLTDRKRHAVESLYQSNRIPFVYLTVNLLSEQSHSVTLVHWLDLNDVSIASGQSECCVPIARRDQYRSVLRLRKKGEYIASTFMCFPRLALSNRKLLTVPNVEEWLEPHDFSFCIQRQPTHLLCLRMLALVLVEKAQGLKHGAASTL